LSVFGCVELKNKAQMLGAHQQKLSEKPHLNFSELKTLVPFFSANACPRPHHL